MIYNIDYIYVTFMAYQIFAKHVQRYIINASPTHTCTSMHMCLHTYTKQVCIYADASVHIHAHLHDIYTDMCVSV